MLRSKDRSSSQAWVKRFNIWGSGAAIAAATLAPAAARATLTISLQLAPGLTGAADTTAYISPTNAGQDIPIYVYATVTGQNAISPVPSGGTTGQQPNTTSGNFDGIQFVYYNVDNAITGTSNGLIDTASGYAPTLNTLGGSGGFAADGSQPGLVQNAPNGISVGSSNLTDPSSGVVFARAGSGIYDNYYTFNAGSQTYTEYGNDSAGDIYLSNNNQSASFLLETLYFKPSFTTGTFTASTTSSAISTAFSISPVNFPSGSEYHDANWFQDLSSQPANGSSPSATQNGSYSAGTSVSFVNTLAGDANDDGTVNFADLLTVAQYYGQSNTDWAEGDFNGDGTTNFSDLLVLAQNYNESLTTSEAAELDAISPSFAATWEQAVSEVAVPEPTSLGILAIGAAAALSRRRRRALTRR